MCERGIVLRKRDVISAVSASLLFLSIGSYASAEEEIKEPSETKIFIDGKKVDFTDVKPTTINDVLMVPIRTLQSDLDTEVKWDNKEKKIISFKKGENQTTKVVYQLNSNYIFHEYQYGPNTVTRVEKIEGPVEQVENRSLVPLLAATESLGYIVDWDKERNTVRITTNEDIQPVQNKNQYKVYGDYSKIKPIELDVFYLTNAERIKAGVSSLAYDVENGEVARLKSKDFHDKEYFDHNSPTYGTPFEMIEKFGISYKSAGENIAAGFKNAQDTVDKWMDSESHKENILREEFNRMGVGYYEGENKYKRYYTQIFTSK